MTGILSEFGQWLQRNDVTIDLITVWTLTVGFLLFALAKTYSWWALRKAQDVTMIGVTLKRQKLAEALIGFAMSALYSMTLYAYYIAPGTFGFWDRLLIRGGVFLAMMMAAWFSIRFVYWLRHETAQGRKGPAPIVDGEEQTG